MWLVPSRRRLTKLRNFCNSAIKTKTTTPALIIVDKKDFEENQDEYAQIEVYHFPVGAGWKIHVSTAEGMGAKIKETHLMWKDAAWVGVLNDDHVLVTPEWDTRLISQLNGRNFLTCNDRWNAPQRAAGATIFSMPLMEAFGFPMFPSQIEHLGIDDVFETIGRATGCWEVDMSVVVEHHHAYKNPDMIDDTHRAVYGTMPWDQSPQAVDAQQRFMAWYKTDFPAVIQRVRELRVTDKLAELPKRT